MKNMFVVVMAMAFLLTSCTSAPSAKLNDGETVINIRVMNEVKNVDKVIARYRELVADDPELSKIIPNITYVTGADYIDKLRMAVTAHEDYDLMFVGEWQGLGTYATTGTFKDLSSYFHNDAYPGLKRAFSTDLIDASRTGDELYVVPLVECFEDLRGLLYREDLRIKYNIPEITNDDILEQYLIAIKENEPELIPWLMTGQGFMLFDSPDFKAKHDNIFAIDLAGVVFYIALDETATRVMDAVVMGDSVEEHFSKLPAPYDTDFIKASYLKKLRWVPYLNEDRTGGGLEGRDAAVFYDPLSLWASENNKAKDKFPEAELGFYVTEEAQRNMEEGAIVSEMKCNNFLCVPAWSKKTDETMKFLDWMFGSRENHDLFQYGIEGEDWEALDEHSYRKLNRNATNEYAMPAYSFTHNPNYIRYSEEVMNNPKIRAYFEYQNSMVPYTVSPIAGFAFNPSSVKTEVASVQALGAEIKGNLNKGVYEDNTEEVIDKFNVDAKKVGLDNIRAELIRQVQEHLDRK